MILWLPCRLFETLQNLQKIGEIDYVKHILRQGMLPEGFIRHSLADRMHIDEKDYISMLHNLGRECIGAVRITTDDEKLMLNKIDW